MPDKTTLIIRHIKTEGPPKFLVSRERDGRSGGTVTIPSPHEKKVEGRPNSNLMQELQWYLETFLDYPFFPSTDRAERVLTALKEWGEDAFSAVFDNRALGRMFDAAVHEDYAALTLRVVADDPSVPAWPWEALRDPEVGVLGHTCQVERRVEKNVREAPPLLKELPSDAVNILLVIARPFENDVAYRSVGRPLIELLESQKLPARVTVLRPPTFKAFREHLAENKGRYHIVHFDGHGGYSDSLLMETDQEAAGHTAQAPHVYGPSGHLHFEPEDAAPEKSAEYIRKTTVTPEQLGLVLREAGVPAVVLNACRSGMIDARAQDPFASVAASLLKAGVRSVVAMAYNLYVSAARQFLPAFYAALFKDGDVAGAVRAGRKELFHEQEP